MPNVIAVDIPSFGQISGVKNENVEKFLGIPYAEDPLRWRKPKLLQSLAGGKHDGSKFGPLTSHQFRAKERALLMWPHEDLTFPDGIQLSEKGSLNLNIWRPTGLGDRTVPVMVYIHGGAFIHGGGSQGLYDGTPLVKHSIDNGNPIVYITINYRLGIQGFMFSQDLITDGEECGEGGAGNYGLWDQRTALEWIQKNIGAFGGDSDRVTIVGESAGSMSVHAHMLAGKPGLFSRGIGQSGTCAEGTDGPISLSVSAAQPLYDQVLEKLNFTLLSPKERLKALREIDAEKIVEAQASCFPGFMPLVLPADDSAISGGFFTYNREQTRGWLFPPNAKDFVKGAIFGDLAEEGILFCEAARSEKYTAEDFVHTLRSPLPGSQGASEALLAQYGLNDPIRFKSTKDMIPGLCDFLTDAFFNAGTDKACYSFPFPTYIYRFDLKNPFETPFRGYSNHTLDMLYTFGTAHHILPSETDRDLEKSFMDAWIAFANGGEPWARKEEGELCVDNEGKVAIKKRGEARNLERLKAMQAEMAALSDVLIAVVTGRIRKV
ncbi:hypothetical protein YB2330_004334 [Saitoella coloradoensis]